MMVNLFRINFANVDNPSVLTYLANSTRLVTSVHLIAVSTLVHSKKSKDLALLINQGIAVCDSKILEKVLRLYFPSFRRLRGVDFLRSFFSIENSANRHFLLGSDEATLKLISMKLGMQYPNTVISGFYSPPFSDIVDLETCANEIRETDANVIWVSLGSPKQDYVAAYLSKTLETRVIAVGAAFDFYSCRKKEAPLKWQNSGFEWLFRLLSEPQRLWRRYLI